MTGFHFDSRTVAPAQAFTLLPAGDYLVRAIKSEITPAKSGNGTVLNMTFEVLEGEFANRKIFSRMNIVNASAQAQEIAQRLLSSLCHAVGVEILNDPAAQLHGRPAIANVTIEKSKDPQYGDKNEIRAFTAYKGAGNFAPPVPQQQAAAPIFPGNAGVASSPNTGMGATPPWAR